MNFKNPNLNLPTKNEGDRKSPLKLRPNLPGMPGNMVNSSRTYSNTMSQQFKPGDPNSMPQPMNPNYSQAQPLSQNPGGLANPLKTTFVHHNAPQPLNPQAPLSGMSMPNNSQVAFNPTTSQGGPIYNPLADSRFAQVNSNPNSMYNLQTSQSLIQRPNMAPDHADNTPKESNLSLYSRGNTMNEQSRFQSNVNPLGRPSEINENMSYHSKMSTNSRNHVLRAISVNNEEHLMNLNNKEDTLKNQNILIVNNFLQSIESSKRNVFRNMTENFKNRVHEIWNSYLMEQLKNGQNNLDVNNLNNDVETIKKVFLDYLLVKTDLYVEELKGGILSDIFKEIDTINNQKQYLDPKVKEIVEISYNPVMSKNTELVDKLKEAKSVYKTLIEQTVQKYEKLRETHIDMYDREFAFKLNGDPNLVKTTLRNALPFLQAENRKADERLNAVRAKGPQTAESLQSEIKKLENDIAFLKNYNK